MHAVLKKSIVVFLFIAFLLQIPLSSLAMAFPQESLTESANQENPVIQTKANSIASSQKHEPVPGIYDGAIYFLRNAANNTYMDVDNEGTASGTNISTYQFHGKLNQQFKFRYLGNEQFELIPMGSPGTVVRAVDTSTGTNIAIDATRSADTRFKVTLVEDGKYVLYSSSHNFTDAVGFDTVRPNNVLQQNYNNYANKEHAHWYLECMDTNVYDNYEKYFIRNVRTGLYLDIVERGETDGTIAHARSLIGSENTQFRKFYCEEENAYQIAPVHNPQLRLTFNANNQLVLCKEGTNNQYFKEEAIGTDDLGRNTYRIFPSVGGYVHYLNMGDAMGEDPTYRYVTFGDDSDDLWVLEPVYFDTTEVYRLEIGEQKQTGVAGNGNKTVLLFQSTRLSRYKLEINSEFLYPISIAVYDNFTGAEPAFCFPNDEHAFTTIYDVCFERGHIYYIEIESLGEAYSPFSIRLRQFAATYHSNNQSDLTSDEGIEALTAYSNWMNWYVTKKAGMTSARAKSEIIPYIGERDFNSEIFIYSGHGNPGILGYEGSSPFFTSLDLPDMSQCELAIFAACHSATATAALKSIVQQSIDNGAKSVIGWKTEIDDEDSNTFLYKFLHALYYGDTVTEAKNHATQSSKFNYAIAIVNGIVLAGDASNRLFPRNVSSSTNSSLAEIAANNLYQRENYTLVAYNCGIKLYTRMINGIPSDDFYMDYFDSNGNYIESWKSPNTLSEELIVELEATNAALVNQKNTEEKLVYTYENGIWQLSVKK